MKDLKSSNGTFVYDDKGFHQFVLDGSFGFDALVRTHDRALSLASAGPSTIGLVVGSRVLALFSRAEWLWYPVAAVLAD
ncbi:MAG TPA: hypothetical protein VNA15_05560 [Candidatus Angelobacter sp.]|nr:hypothetical protein [Candidatus Angelobacter sp.]